MATDSAVTQRAFLTGARLKLSRLQLDGDLDRLYRQVAEISAQALNVARVGVWLFDGAGLGLHCKMLWDGKGDGPPPPLLMSKHPEYLAAIRERRYVASTDARTQSNTKELLEYLETWHITSLLDAALYRNGQVVGIVCHEHVGEPREWKREECQFASTVADLLSYFLEVNDRLAAEAQAHALALKLKDAHRLDALGRMAAGVAHDLNNLLGVITNGIIVMQRGGGLDVLQQMEESARHAAALVSQLMSLGRQKTPVAQNQPLDPLLADFERLLAGHTSARTWERSRSSATLGERSSSEAEDAPRRSDPATRVVFDVEKGLQVWADAAQLQQVLMNLVTNAMQAMPKGGVVVLRAHGRKGGVSFEVIDTGEGIAAENLERLFDPFFTTRPEGHGIGLAVVQQVVAQHGGEVQVSSTIGDGTTFTVWWPSEVPA